MTGNHSGQGANNSGSSTSFIQSIRNSRQFALLKSAAKFLQDNRASDGGDPETAEKLKEINRSQNDSCPFLKSVLNCMFVTVGVVLLLGVLTVILYTSLVKPGSDEDVFRNIWLLYVNNQDSATLQNVPIENSSTDLHHQQLTSSEEVQRPPVPAAVRQYDVKILSSSSSSSSASDHPEVIIKDHINPVRKIELEQSHSSDVTLKEQLQPVLNKRPRYSEPQVVSVSSEKTEVRCRYVPVVYRGQTVVQLGQICYEVVQTTTGPGSSLL